MSHAEPHPSSSFEPVRVTWYATVLGQEPDMPPDTAGVLAVYRAPHWAPAATRQPAAPGARQVAQGEPLWRAKSSTLTNVPSAPEKGASAVLTGLEGIRTPGQTLTEATTTPPATAEQPAKSVPAPAPLSKAAEKATYRNDPTADEALKLLETQERKRKVLQNFTVTYDKAVAKTAGLEGAS